MIQFRFSTVAFTAHSTQRTILAARYFVNTFLIIFENVACDLGQSKSELDFMKIDRQRVSARWCRMSKSAFWSDHAEITRP